MDWFQALVLALIQGLTEFLPISSSAHLILPSEVLGWPDQGLAFDVAVHVGTLVAGMAYYRRDLLAMLGGAGSQSTTHEPGSETGIAGGACHGSCGGVRLSGR